MAVPPGTGTRLLAFAGLLVLYALAMAAPAGLAAAPAHSVGGATPGALFHSTKVTSSNWAGWAVSTSSLQVTDVKASWIVPSIHGSCGGGWHYSSFWVGIDGYSSSTVEQIGTDSDCSGSTHSYYAWYEFYPNPSHVISMTIHPGNVMSAEVKYVSGHFQVRISNHNTSKLFWHNATVSGAQRNSAEWIAEAPSSSSGILPLANFGTVYFGTTYTGLTSTNQATIGGVAGSIGHFSSSAHQITMVSSTKTKAAASALTGSGRSFSVVWKSAGP